MSGASHIISSIFNSTMSAIVGLKPLPARRPKAAADRAAADRAAADMANR